MNKNQRYYAFLALVSNQDFVNEVKQLRISQSFQDHVFPENGFLKPEDADGFIKAQDEAIQKKKLIVFEHPFWSAEKNLVALIEQFGLQIGKDEHLRQMAIRYFYLNSIDLLRDRLKLSFSPKNRNEITITLFRDTTRADLERNITMILDFKREMLGAQSKKQAVPKFERDLIFYKLYLTQKKLNTSLSDYQAIDAVYEEISKMPEDENPDLLFSALFDQRNAERLVKRFNKMLGSLKLIPE